jgi:hypothetical protein
MARQGLHAAAWCALLAACAAQTSSSGESGDTSSADSGNEHCVSPGQCISSGGGAIVVNALSPPGGPLDGSTMVVVVGHGYRNFGSLMRCRFGQREVTARLHVEPGQMASPYNHTMMACDAPGSPTPYEQSVSLEVSLNGQDYSSSGRSFTYYRHPSLVGVSPQRGSAATSQALTLTRSTATLSGGWTPVGSATSHMCKFTAVVLPDGRRQVPFVAVVNASVADATELLCVSPPVSFVAPVRVEVALNGQQFSVNGPLFTYEDNWHSPATSGVGPSGRHGMASSLVGSVAYYFGGEDGLFAEAGEGFAGDLWGLHLDAMSDYYPSETARDLAWQKLSLSSSGDAPSPRSYASLVAWGTTLVLFGGTSSVWADMHNSTYEFSTARKVWQQVAVSGGPVTPRSAHSAVVCSLRNNCETSDGRPRMFVFGGWGLAPCGGSRPCLTHQDELVSLDLNSMTWQPVAINEEQPRPPARKGHSANLVNGSIMIVFGGSAWVADEDADNSYGFSTHHVNDLWSIDLSGRDGYTWRAVYAVGERPGPREAHGATLLGGRYLVIHGGYDHASGYRNDTYVLDTASEPMVWTRPTLTGARPASRHGHSLMRMDDDEVLLFGGLSEQGFESDVHVLQVGVGNAAHYAGLTHGA